MLTSGERWPLCLGGFASAPAVLRPASCLPPMCPLHSGSQCHLCWGMAWGGFFFLFSRRATICPRGEIRLFCVGVQALVLSFLRSFIESCVTEGQGHILRNVR